MQSISLSSASRNLGCSHPRFSSRSSLVMVGKNRVASKNGPSCSMMRWIVALPISILAGKMDLRLYFKDRNSRRFHSSWTLTEIGGRCSGPHVLKDHVRTLLADHDRGGVGIAGNDRRHDRGIDHAQTRESAYAQPFIDHGLRILAHAAGADGMIGSRAAAAD